MTHRPHALDIHKDDVTRECKTCILRRGFSAQRSFPPSDVLSPLLPTPEQCVCLDCKKSFCPSCAHQPESGPCLCHLCERFRATAFLREELIKMKVKDLRDYLELREISTEMCREKDELVCLIISQQPLDPQRERGPRVPHPVPVSVAQEECTTTPVSLNFSPEQISTNPALQGRLFLAMADNSLSQHSSAVLMAVSEMDEVLYVQRIYGTEGISSDLTSVRDIDALSVRQLKEILARNFVNYKGCCEKWELMERVTRLYKEKDLQQLAPSGNATLPGSEENLCKICMDSIIDCVLLECGHMVTCTKCGKRMNECPICRQYVIRAVHVFRT
uniref:RING-type E3 ubiquitin transferase n=1 Tax=Naja naja TaxID=35670 RepID=A0A8C6Y2C9_NAJNA